MNIGTDEGLIPAKLSDSVRAMVTAGLAKLVEDVNQYAPAIQSPTAYGTASARPVRMQPWMTSSSPIVATTSDSHSAPDERAWVESSIAGSSNMTLARIAPAQPPTICATTWTIGVGGV